MEYYRSMHVIVLILRTISEMIRSSTSCLDIKLSKGSDRCSSHGTDADCDRKWEVADRPAVMGSVTELLESRHQLFYNQLFTSPLPSLAAVWSCRAPTHPHSSHSQFPVAMMTGCSRLHSSDLAIWNCIRITLTSLDLGYIKLYRPIPTKLGHST